MAAIPKLFASLAGLPIEILLEVYQHLDLQSIFELSLTNTEFFLFFQRRKIDILLPVLRRDFSPLDELLQIYTASADDIVNGGLYKPRMVVFQRFAGDGGVVLSPGAPVSSLAVQRAGEKFTEVTNGGKALKVSESLSNAVVLTGLDLNGLLKKCRLVREWEELFPQMRWFHQPEDCRLLRHHEQVRFRKALYRWWLYGIYFHGEFPRPRAGHPEPFVDDIRTSQMRYHSTADLLELMDFLETIKDVILQYICPRLDPTQQQVCPCPSPQRGQFLLIRFSRRLHRYPWLKMLAGVGPSLQAGTTKVTGVVLSRRTQNSGQKRFCITSKTFTASRESDSSQIFKFDTPASLSTKSRSRWLFVVLWMKEAG